MRREITAPDGRTLVTYAEGPEDGLAIVVHHGTPMSGLLYDRWVQDAAQRGARMVSYSRPGYGGSTRDPGRSVADAARDTAIVLDALGVERFVTWGISGGGPHALACAALLPDRCAAAASLASIAPYDAEGLDFLAGMGEENVEEFDNVLAGEDALRPSLEAWASQMAGVRFEEAAPTLVSDVDRDALGGELGDYMDEANGIALSTGVDGWLDDDLAFVQPWGFDLGAIEVPALVWQGRHDLMVPPAHGEWLGEHVAGADARLTEDDGHLTLITRRVPEVHAWLLERL